MQRARKDVQHQADRKPRRNNENPEDDKDLKEWHTLKELMVSGLYWIVVRWWNKTLVILVRLIPDMFQEKIKKKIWKVFKLCLKKKKISSCTKKLFIFILFVTVYT